jgi:hypothetical protein
MPDVRTHRTLGAHCTPRNERALNHDIAINSIPRTPCPLSLSLLLPSTRSAIDTIEMHDVNHTRSVATHLAMTAVRVTAMWYTMYISKIKQLVQYNRIDHNYH